MTDQTAPPAPAPRKCFYVDETMATPHGYIPSLVTEDEPGHSPMIGSGDFAEPWYWGKDLDTARRIAAESNAKMGVSEQDAAVIVASSIRASIVQDAGRLEFDQRIDDLRHGRQRRADRDPFA